VLTSLLGSAETFNIDYTVEVFDDLRQLYVDFFDGLLVSQPARRSRCEYQYLLKLSAPTMFDIVARNFCDPVHHLKHSRNDLLQEVRLFTGDFFRNHVRERQNALQPVQKTRWYLVVFVLFFQELTVKSYLRC